MRFTLIDRIMDLAPGERITAVKNLSMAEEYLADHFPGFPVIPGVLMLEAMTEASAWLIRATEDFAHSMVLLKEARNVRFANFLRPGQTLIVTAEIIEQDERYTRLKASGSVDGSTTVSARLIVERFNQAEDRPDRRDSDEVVKRKLREQFSLLYQSQVPAA